MSTSQPVDSEKPTIAELRCIIDNDLVAERITMERYLLLNTLISMLDDNNCIVIGETEGVYLTITRVELGAYSP